VRRRLVVAAACLLLAGCARPVVSEFTQARQPYCEAGGESGTPFLVLMAQAVPSASQLPCVELLPAGWSVSNTFVRDGRARFALDSDRVGMRAVQVVLERTCRFEGGTVTRVPSDEPGMRRFERIGEVRPGVGFTGTRFYLFKGGCVTYRFQFKTEERAGPIGEVTLALSFISRDTLRDLIRETTDGRAQLDHPAQAGNR
jgi:hypothetical protein